MLDFTTRKKKKYMVKLHDGFVAVLPMPSKKIFDRLTAAQERSDIGEVYSLLTAIINQNKKRRYSQQKIEDMFDFADAVELLKDYLGSVKDVVTDPN